MRDLDCVIIGYNDVDTGAMAARLRTTTKYSGAYRNYETNTAPVAGGRVPYMTLLNQAVAEASGRPSRLHVADLPNLAVTYLASFLRRRDLRVELINFFNGEQERLIDLLASRPSAVAITTTFYVDGGPIAEIVRFVRERSPETRIIVGGPHIYNICSHVDSLTQNTIFKQLGADIFVFDSQGELTLSRVLLALRDPTPDLDAIPNLVYKDGKTFKRSTREIESNDLDENAIDWTSFSPDYYTPTVQMRTARSCSFNCAFCRYPVMAGALSLTSLEVVEAELRYLREHGVRNVVFIDDTFNVPLPRFKDLCRMMIRNKFGFQWFSYFRCSNADTAAFDLMAEAGCKGVFLGIESGDNTILANMNKFAKIERYRHGIKMLKERGIVTFASLIVGFPGETEQTIRNTIEFVEEAAPAFYRAELYYHDANAPIQQKAEQYGITSAGYSWKHNTMNWQQATAAIDDMYRSINNATVLPLYMFDFWSLPYLVGRGISLEQVQRFVGTAQRGLVRSLDDPTATVAPDWADLVSIFASAN